MSKHWLWITALILVVSGCICAPCADREAWERFRRLEARTVEQKRADVDFQADVNLFVLVSFGLGITGMCLLGYHMDKKYGTGRRREAP